MLNCGKASTIYIVNDCPPGERTASCDKLCILFPTSQLKFKCKSRSSAGMRWQRDPDVNCYLCSWCGMLCAGIGKATWQGETVVFCSPEQDLWRGYHKEARTLFLYVPAVPLRELLSMKSLLPQYQVRHTLSCTAICYTTSPLAKAQL